MGTRRSAEIREIFSGSIVRVLGLPITVAVGLANTALIIANTGQAVFGLVSTISTLSLLMPFADLGLGAVITTACARAQLDEKSRAEAIATLRTASWVLLLVMSVGVLVTVGAAMGGWLDILFATALSPGERWIVTASIASFFLGVPLSLATRVLIGLGRNGSATALSMTGGVFAFGVSITLAFIHADPLWYAASGPAGPTLATALAVPFALRALRSENITPFGAEGRRTLYRVAPDLRRKAALLAGSGWMVVVMVGLPLGLQTGRLFIAHTQSAEELSSFALAAQLYTLAWGVMVAAGNALWTQFARKREDTAATFTSWRLMVLLFGGLAIIGGTALTFLGPPLASWVSGGRIQIDTAQMAAFSVLILMQALHLPAGVMLTMPHELRWQAGCTTVLAIVSLSGSFLLAPLMGGIGVSLSAAAGVLVGQLIPDLMWMRRHLARREKIFPVLDAVG